MLGHGAKGGELSPSSPVKPRCAWSHYKALGAEGLPLLVFHNSQSWWTCSIVPQMPVAVVGGLPIARLKSSYLWGSLFKSHVLFHKDEAVSSLSMGGGFLPHCPTIHPTDPGALLACAQAVPPRGVPAEPPLHPGVPAIPVCLWMDPNPGDLCSTPHGWAAAGPHTNPP